MQNNQSIMQISENKDGSAKVLFRIRKAEMTDVDEIMAVMHEAKNDKEHPDWFVSDDEEYVRTHIEEQGFVIVAQTADGSVAGFFLIKYPENREDNLGTYLDFDEEQLSPKLDHSFVHFIARADVERLHDGEKNHESEGQRDKDEVEKDGHGKLQP